MNRFQDFEYLWIRHNRSPFNRIPGLKKKYIFDNEKHLTNKTMTKAQKKYQENPNISYKEFKDLVEEHDNEELTNFKIDFAISILKNVFVLIMLVGIIYYTFYAD